MIMKRSHKYRAGWLWWQYSCFHRLFGTVLPTQSHSQATWSEVLAHLGEVLQLSFLVSNMYLICEVSKWTPVQNHVISLATGTVQW